MLLLHGDLGTQCQPDNCGVQIKINNLDSAEMSDANQLRTSQATMKIEIKSCRWTRSIVQ